MDIFKMAAEMIINILAVIGVCSVVFECIRISARRKIQSHIALVVKLNRRTGTEGQLRMLVDSGITEDAEFDQIAIIKDNFTRDDEEICRKFALSDGRIRIVSGKSPIEGLF